MFALSQSKSPRRALQPALALEALIAKPRKRVIEIRIFLNNFMKFLPLEIYNLNYKNIILKKNLAQTKINQMKESAIKEIKDTSIKIAIDSVKKIITTTVDKSKLDNLFEKNLEETKSELKKINS